MATLHRLALDQSDSIVRSFEAAPVTGVTIPYCYLVYGSNVDTTNEQMMRGLFTKMIELALELGGRSYIDSDLTYITAPKIDAVKDNLVLDTTVTTEDEIGIIVGFDAATDKARTHLSTICFRRLLDGATEFNWAHILS